jgi:hypothetical protein
LLRLIDFLAQKNINEYVMRKFLILFLLLAVVTSGCKTVWKGTVGGATAGVIVGGSAGKLLGNTAVGALGGALIGGSIGAISSSIRKKNIEKNEKLPSADTTKIFQKVSVPTRQQK